MGETHVDREWDVGIAEAQRWNMRSELTSSAERLLAEPPSSEDSLELADPELANSQCPKRLSQRIRPWREV